MNQPHKDKEWLKEKVEAGLTNRQIADLCGLASTSTVTYLISKWELKKTKNPLTNYDWFYEQYITLDKTPEQIALEVGKPLKLVYNWAWQHQIHKRDIIIPGTYKDEQWLTEMLINQGMYYWEVAEEAGVCEDTIYYWAVEKYNIRKGKLLPKIPKSMLDKLNDHEWLKTEYVDKGRFKWELADELGVHTSTITRRVRNFEIEKYIGGRLPGSSLSIPCSYCGKTITVVRSRFEKNDNCFCNKSCRSDYDRTQGLYPILLEKKEWLFQKLIDENMMYQEVADLLQIEKTQLAYFAPLLGINKTELKLKGGINQENTKYLKDEEWLRHHYLELDLTTEEIAEFIDVGSTTVSRYLESFGIVKEYISQETSIERIMRGLLENESITFEAQFKVPNSRYRADFYLDEYNIIIECDGDYWHANPQMFPDPTESQLKVIQKDSNKNAFYRNAGYVVFRFWENDIWDNREMCFQQVLDKISEVDSLRKKVVK
jgi:very-short-patch-repair endonuclease